MGYEPQQLLPPVVAALEALPRLDPNYQWYAACTTDSDAVIDPVAMMRLDGVIAEILYDWVSGSPTESTRMLDAGGITAVGQSRYATTWAVEDRISEVSSSTGDIQAFDVELDDGTAVGLARPSGNDGVLCLPDGYSVADVVAISAPVLGGSRLNGTACRYWCFFE